MAQKHLHELLKQDQEPFTLKTYIADRRCQLKKPLPNSHLQLRKRKPLSENSIFTGNFCKNACLFSLNDSPDLRKSPLFEFQSPVKSPCKSPNTIFLHIPTSKAAVLLEAALRIHKQTTSAKSKAQSKSQGFGLFGSFLKRITNRNRTRKSEMGGDGVKLSVKDILQWDSSIGQRKSYSETKRASDTRAFETGFPCSCNGRLSSALWSESNEEISVDMETSCSSHCEDYNEIGFVSQLRKSTFACENHFCESPFRFVLQRSPSSGQRTPDFSSPASSPSHHEGKDKINDDVESLKKSQVVEEEEEEDKEQCSPVSVLDPPFQDDEDGHDGEDENENGYDLERSYAIVERAKQQLLSKLRRFERLAELDPIELEKRMIEDEEQDEGDDYDNENDFKERETNTEWYIREVISNSNLSNPQRFMKDIRKLVSHLIAEESRNPNVSENYMEEIVKRACKRLESWEEVGFNTIDMMVEQDLKREPDVWKVNREQMGETVVDVELEIFHFLVEEIAIELSFDKENCQLK